MLGCRYHGIPVTGLEHLAEHDAATHRVSQLLRPSCASLTMPDAPGRPTTWGGSPERVLGDSRQRHYVIDVGRLVPLSVRKPEAFIHKQLSRRVSELPIPSY